MNLRYMLALALALVGVGAQATDTLVIKPEDAPANTSRIAVAPHSSVPGLFAIDTYNGAGEKTAFYAEVEIKPTIRGNLVVTPRTDIPGAYSFDIYDPNKTFYFTVKATTNNGRVSFQFIPEASDIKGGTVSIARHSSEAGVYAVDVMKPGFARPYYALSIKIVPKNKVGNQPFTGNLRAMQNNNSRDSLDTVHANGNKESFFATVTFE